jgi:CO/xanthine dehydrogenase FAD-binding subunit
VKPGRFDYVAPVSLLDALAVLGEDAVPLAGGQSLMPLLNLRLARPELVVDLNGVSELDYLSVDQGGLRIGAMVRQAALEASSVVARDWPLLSQAMRLAGHRATRSRGTVGGSVAHADPAAELPAALLALDARFHLRSASSARAVAAGEFFLGPLTTVREADELLVEIEVPPLPAGAGTAFVEVARTHGDFATAGAAAVLGGDGGAAIGLLGVGGTPRRAVAAEAALGGGASIREAALLAGELARDEWRRALLVDLVGRALSAAALVSEDGGA